MGDHSEIRVAQLCQGDHPLTEGPGRCSCGGLRAWENNVGNMRSERLHVNFRGYGGTHHFRVRGRGKLCERKEIELWRLRQSLINSIFGTGKKVKCEYGEVLYDPYFERI